MAYYDAKECLLIVRKEKFLFFFPALFTACFHRLTFVISLNC